MGQLVVEGISVVALAVTFIAWLYFRNLGRQKRLEIVHQERLAAMDKGIPLPELPLDPSTIPKHRDPHALLLHGMVWLALGGGAMAAVVVSGDSFFAPWVWPLPLPLAMLGLGLILVYALTYNRER